jgi:transposase
MTLIDDELWQRIEPLLPKRRPRNRRYAGRKPIPDRAALTGILFVLRSGIPWNMLPKEMGCGSGSACWRRLARWQRAGVWQRLHRCLLTELAGAAASIWNGRSSTVRPSARCGGEKNWTEPYRSPQSRVEASCSHRRRRGSARRAPHGGEPARCDAVVALGRCGPRDWRATGPAAASAGRRARRSRLRFAAPPAPADAPHRARARQTPDAPRQRPWPYALARRTHVGVAPPLSPPRRPIRTSTVYP